MNQQTNGAGDRKKLGILLIGILVLFVIPCATLGRSEPVERSPEERQTEAVIVLTVEATWGPALTATSVARKKTRVALETRAAGPTSTSSIKIIRAYKWLQWYAGLDVTSTPTATPTPTATAGG